MRTKIWHILSIGALVVLVVVGIGLVGIGSQEAQAAGLPVTPCVSAGPSAYTCDLWAKTGTLSLPNAVSVPIWGYADSSGGAAQVPGPALIVNQGDTVTVTLHNTLAETSTLQFSGQAMVPDYVGAPAGGTATYVFAASNPGTFLYEAGPLPNSQHQVAMGLYGTLVVRPTATPPAGFVGQAYTAPETAFTDEALLVLGEIDPALNNSSTPETFDMRDFAPHYYLINGKAYPNTDEITTTVGVTSTVLLRYVNAGIQYHSMALLGLDQVVIADDGFPLTYFHHMTAETIGPGQTLDVLVTVPASVPQGSKFAIYDANLMFHNGSAAGYGGMLTFLSRPPALPPGADVAGPATSAMALVPNPTNGAVSVALAASVSDVATGGANVAAAEYFIGSPSGAPGTGTAMAAADGAFDTPTEAVSATISAVTLAGLSSGNHTIYVHGQDSLGNWGPFNFIVLNLDKTGPTSTGLTLIPNPSNGTADVALHATGDDRVTGGGTVVAAEYFIGATGAPGTGTAMAVTPSDPVVNLNATIPAASVNALAEGTYTVSVRSQDTLGNWGDFGTIALQVDKTGPATGAVSAAPNPNNGTVGVNTYAAVVRVTAIVSDPLSGGVQSNISYVEGFIDTVGANGTGFVFVATDGLYNSPSEPGYADIPLATIATLSAGPHTIYVHGRDAAGNWGANNSTVLVIDKVSPAVSGLTAVANPTNAGNSNQTSFVLSGTATDPVVPGTGAGSTIVAAEWFEGTDLGAGNGNPMTGAFTSPTENISATIDFVARGWAAGDYTLFVRAKDAAGNWSTPVSIVVTVVLPNTIFADGFDAGNFAAWTSAFNVAPFNVPGISAWPIRPQSGGFSMQARLNGNTPAYVTDSTPVLDPSYHARFYFNPHGVATGNATQSMTIFAGRNSVGTTIFQVQYRRLSISIYQVRLAVLRAGGTTTTAWYSITNNAWNAIEIAWQSGPNATASLYTGGILRQSLTGLDTSAYLLDEVRLGPSAGLVAASGGTMYFDSFVSTRNTVINPDLAFEVVTYYWWWPSQWRRLTDW